MIGLRRSYTARSRDFSGIAARQFWDLEGEGERGTTPSWFWRSVNKVIEMLMPLLF